MTLVKGMPTQPAALAANPNAIGGGIYGEYAGDKQFKMLKIGFKTRRHVH